MGITGLIPFLEKSSRRVHLKELSGCAVAVDSYCWLHKGVFSCAEKLVRGEETDMYLQYCLKYVHLLLSYDIKPIMVFDGRHLPAKALTEHRRRESRQKSKKLAAEFLRKGEVEKARSHMRRCVDVKHEMALRLIRECRQRNVDCIVAPYEADAQMAWLDKVDLVQYVITEDSDLTLFGARKIIFKLDLTGAGLLVESEKLHLAMECRKEKYNFEKFRRMCILSGCDYLDSLPGIGLAKGCKFILMTEEDNMWIALKKLPKYLNMKNLEVDDEYIDNFLKAEATFRHMYVYNPLERRMERLYELCDYQTEERYCSNAGSLLEDKEQALQMALGNVNPFTLKQLDNWHPDRNFGLAQATSKTIKRAKHKSIWQTNYKTRVDDNGDLKNDTAIVFKKINFFSKTISEIDAEIEQQESDKPEEADVFSIYKKEANNLEVSEAKRRRLYSDSSDTSDTSECQNNTKAPEDVLTNAHNPFKKINATAETNSSTYVCEKASLLKECKEGLAGQSQVEVKSRFFSANLKHLENYASEIQNIEDLARTNRENQQSLYNSPSPKKVEAADNTLSCLCNKEKDVCDCTELQESDIKNEAICCSSDDDEKMCGKLTQATQKIRSIGLSRTKTTSNFKATKSKRTKLSATIEQGKSQPLLTMFGFQKRPTLK